MHALRESAKLVQIWCTCRAAARQPGVCESPTLGVLIWVDKQRNVCKAVALKVEPDQAKDGHSHSKVGRFGVLGGTKLSRYKVMIKLECTTTIYKGLSSYQGS